MTYSSNEKGTANLILDPEEHARFKAGKAVVKFTADAYGEYHLVVKKVCIGFAYIITDLDTKEQLPTIYAANKYKAVRKQFGEDIAHHHGSCDLGNIISLRNGKRYALKRKLRK